MTNREYIRNFSAGDSSIGYYDIQAAAKAYGGSIERLPYSIRILVENILRKQDDRTVTEENLANILGWKKTYEEPVEIPYHPARVLMQDFTGVPAVVDLAAMRDAMQAMGGDPERVNPVVPVELVADHSVQLDYSGTTESLAGNVAKEYERNGERYALLKWAQKNFDNFKVVPPNSGICHQVNLEHLGRVIITEQTGDGQIAYPDTLVGLDSHTPMINALGVMGWGVGGIEAEAVMLGQPYYMSIPEVIGVRLNGRLNTGVTATDLVLTITELLRKTGVVEKFVEYFGPGMQELSIPDRATIANMTPEYGATLGFFPIDEKTIDYLVMTGREAQAVVAHSYAKQNGFLYRDDEAREYTRVVDLDLSSVEPSLAGPSRPQDRIPLSDIKNRFRNLPAQSGKTVPLTVNGRKVELTDGSVVIAAITSCTNTSNPQVLVGAALMAREAVRRGLTIPAFVKTSFAPGSKVVKRYLEASGLMPYLEALGFHIAAFGCTTCIGNSGPLKPELEQAIRDHDLNVAAVLSGNRNFEARIHQLVKSNYLTSPLLVVAFALAGRIDMDFAAEPLALDPNGRPVFLADIWPDEKDIAEIISAQVTSNLFREEYMSVFSGDAFWKKLPVTENTTFNWDDASTYIRKPPFFDSFGVQPPDPEDITNARALLVLGDTVTTDHISPAGAISPDYPAGHYLAGKGIDPVHFNSYGSRRGNHEVMMRGTFGNIRIKNRMVSPKEGAWTVKFPEGTEQYTYDTALEYQQQGTPLIVLAGKEYGTGSSRDWAAKGTALLGVRAVIAVSYERIHRSNLVGMGVLPLVFSNGKTVESLGLDGTETFTIAGLHDLSPRKRLEVVAVKPAGQEIRFEVTARVDNDIEVAWWRNGGILNFVLRQMLGEQPREV